MRYDRNPTVLQFIAGCALFAVSIVASIGVFVGEAAAPLLRGGFRCAEPRAGVFNTWDLIFRVQRIDEL